MRAPAIFTVSELVLLRRHSGMRMARVLGRWKTCASAFDLSGKALGDIKLSTEEGSGGIDWLENMAPSSVPATAHRIPVSGELLILHHRQIERVS